MLAATGSTITAATDSSRAGTWLYGTTRVSATAPAGTPAVPGIPSVATPLPPAASRASVAPWKLPWNDTIRSRPVKPRASRTAVLVASVPEFISRACSQLGDPRRDLLGELHLPRRRGAVRRAVGGGSADRRRDRRMGVAEDHRPVALHEIDVAPPFDVEDVGALGPGDDVRLAADRLEGADRRVDPAGDGCRRPGEQCVVRRHPRPVHTTGSHPAAGQATGSQYGIDVTGGER